MRPRSLRIEGFRSFRMETEIDFGGRDHVAVVGDTGAGKSSILEAMTYALYGKTSFAGQAQELMNDASDKMRVVLRFHVSGQEWEVARALRRDSKGVVRLAGAQLQRLGEDGKALERVEQVRQVAERIAQLIGLDSDAFLRTVVLPQGRFARLLVEDKPATRSTVLRQVWPTEELEEVGALASRALQDVKEVRAQLQQEKRAHPDDPAAHLAELTAEAESTKRQAEEASALAQKASKALVAMREAETREQTATEAGARLQPGVSQIDEAETKVAPIAEELRGIDEEDGTLKRKQVNVRGQLASLPSDDGPGLKEVAAALAALQRFGDLAAAAIEAADELRDKTAGAARHRQAATEARDVQQKAAEGVERHAQLRRPLAKTADAARVRRGDAVHAHNRCTELHRATTKAQEKVASLDDRRAERAVQVESAAKEQAQVAEAAAAADDRLAEARRANSAAAAAHGLHPGDDCPVCRRDLPEGWSPPPDAGIAAAEAGAQKARSAAEASAQRTTRIRAELQAAKEQLRDAQAVAKGALDQHLAALAKMIEQFGDGSTELPSEGAPADADGPPPLPSLDALLRPLDASHQKASDALTRHDDKHKALGYDLESLSNAATKAEAEATAGTERMANARRTANDALARLNQNVSETPAAYRPQVELPAEPAELHKIDASAADSPIKAARDRERVLESREQRRQQLSRELEEADKKRDLLAQRRTKVEQPLAAITATLGRHRDVLLRAVHALALGDGTDIPGAPSTHDPAAFQQWMRRLRTETSTAVEAASSHAKQAAADAQVAKDALGDVSRRLAETPTAPSTPEAVVIEADNARDKAKHLARSADDERNAFAAIKDDVLALHALLDEADELERALIDLEKALKPGAFLKWLTLRRSRSLLVHASRMLSEISDGKYAFADPGDEEARWMVVDNESGQPRSPASLSGGEQFIASLALALGMVEMMARSGGHLESLFLDEGFGSLDRNNLDAAVEALGTVAAKGRMVGVISHVRAVAEQIDDVLAVERDATGTQVRWLSREERGQMARLEAEWDASSAAIEGLLE